MRASHVRFPLGSKPARAANAIVGPQDVTAGSNADGGIEVVQNIRAITVLPESERQAGSSSSLYQREMKRVDRYRNAASEANSNASDLAERGFRDIESAKRAVHTSTKAVLDRYYLDMYSRYDLMGDKH